MRRRTVKRTLSNQKLWWRMSYEGAAPLWCVHNNAACKPEHLVATIPGACLFDAQGNWFAENA